MQRQMGKPGSLGVAEMVALDCAQLDSLRSWSLANPVTYDSVILCCTSFNQACVTANSPR